MVQYGIVEIGKDAAVSLVFSPTSCNLRPPSSLVLCDAVKSGISETVEVKSRHRTVW